MDIKEAIDALQRLVECPNLQEPDLHRDSLEEETVLALAEAHKVLDTYYEERELSSAFDKVVKKRGKKQKGSIDGYPYLPLDKIPGYKETQRKIKGRNTR